MPKCGPSGEDGGGGEFLEEAASMEFIPEPFCVLLVDDGSIVGQKRVCG